jgi:hypothetical protein
MIIAIMQPTFIPWVGYFDMMDKVDLFLYLDDVQLQKRSWQVRNKLKNKNGEYWLTIPIAKKSSRNETLISNAEISYNTNWIQKSLKTIEYSYKKTEYFEEVFPFVCSMFNEEKLLSDFNIGLIERVRLKLKIKTRAIRTSEIKNVKGSKDERLVQIITKLKYGKYLSPLSSANYINRKSKGGEFAKKNIELYYNSYEHPVYQQLNTEFTAYLGILDLLFNVGFNNSLETIISGRQKNIHYTKI